MLSHAEPGREKGAKVRYVYHELLLASISSIQAVARTRPASGDEFQRVIGGHSPKQNRGPAEQEFWL